MFFYVYQLKDSQSYQVNSANSQNVATCWDRGSIRYWKKCFGAFIYLNIGIVNLVGYLYLFVGI